MFRLHGFAEALCSVALASGVAVPASAQELKRTELSRMDLTGVEGKEVVVSLLEAPPGSTSVRHFHYGDEDFLRARRSDGSGSRPRAPGAGDGERRQQQTRSPSCGLQSDRREAAEALERLHRRQGQASTG